MEDKFYTVPMVIVNWDHLAVQFMGTEVPLSPIALGKNIVGCMLVYNDQIRALEDFPDAQFMKVEKKEKGDGLSNEEGTTKTE